MGYNLIAIQATPAPREMFPTRYNSEQGSWIPYLINHYIDTTECGSTIWECGVQELYEGLSHDLADEEKQQELLQEMRSYDEDLELEDLIRLRDFLKVCVDNGYILNEWY